jgi:hypothetical protein
MKQKYQASNTGIQYTRHSAVSLPEIVEGALPAEHGVPVHTLLLIPRLQMEEGALSAEHGAPLHNLLLIPRLLILINRYRYKTKTDKKFKTECNTVRRARQNRSLPHANNSSLHAVGRLPTER